MGRARNTKKSASSGFEREDTALRMVLYEFASAAKLYMGLRIPAKAHDVATGIQSLYAARLPLTSIGTCLASV